MNSGMHTGCLVVSEIMCLHDVSSQKLFPGISQVVSSDLATRGVYANTLTVMDVSMSC